MGNSTPPSAEILDQVVEAFWESIPPFWHSVRAHIRQVAFEQFEISVEQFHILRHIRRGVHSVSELAEVKHISRPAISQAVDALVAKGLIARRPNAQDRRHVQLELTAEGEALLDAVFENTCFWMKDTLSSLEEAEAQTLLQALHIFQKVLPL